MKNLLRIMCLLLLSGVSHADEQPDFTGYYMGATAGVTVAGVNLHANHLGFVSMAGVCDSDGSFVSLSPGAHLGGMYALGPQIRLAIEGTFNYNTPQTVNLKCRCPTTTTVSDNFNFSSTMQGTFRSRVGYLVVDNLLPYFVVGGNLAALSLSYSNESNDTYAANVTQMGLLLGAGLEWKMAESWSLRGQYHFIVNTNADLRISTIYGLTDPDGAAHAASYSNSLELGLSYWFQ